MSKQQRDSAREQHWRSLVAEWKSSGQSVRAFCSQRQVREANFYAWRRELRLRDAEVVAARPAFVPVTVTGDVATVEVRCPSGHVVTVANANIDTLRQLFAALAVPTPC